MKVSERIRKGKKVILGEVIRESGYSLQTSLKPSLVTNTKSFNKALEVERKPLMEMLEREIADIQLAMSKKDKNKEDYRILAGSLDIMLRNKHVLNGGVSSVNVFVLPSEVMEQNNIKQTSSQVIDIVPKDVV